MNCLKLIGLKFIILFFIFCLSDFKNVLSQDNLKYCNAVQNNVGFIRYPLGTVPVSSTTSGELADAMTLVPKIYPCLEKVVVKKENDDWRAAVSGDPSMLTVNYKADKPCGATTTNITVTPHLSVFRINFPSSANNKYLVFDFSKYRVDNWAKLYKWTERTITQIDKKTLRATIGEPGKKGAYYTIKFSTPCTSFGIFDSTDKISSNVRSVSGTHAGMYAKFDANSVTITIAESFVGIDQTEQFLRSEFSDFETVHQKCKSAWNKVINEMDIQGSENSKRMAYTALFTMYANIIDGSAGSAYNQYYSRPRSIASSAYWQFIGGFQSCAWDNYRTAYPFLMLSYPKVMGDVVNTYLARYKRDGYVDGNICLFTGPTGDHKNMRFCSVLIDEAYHSGVKADYSNLYAALKSNYNNPNYFPSNIINLGYAIQPVTGGKACSETLEWTTGLNSMAALAKVNNDPVELKKYWSLSKCYRNIWDSTNQLFRVKNEDGTWGVIDNKKWTWDPNPQGLFEGTNKDWMFSVPHDPYGLMNLPNQTNFSKRVIDYCTNDSWFNDYQYHYPYLLYYSGEPNTAQKIIRDTWMPMFKSGVMYEGVSPKPPYKGWKTHYTSNAGWLMCSMIGLYPVPSPAGQYIIMSPSVDKSVIHNNGKDITIVTRNNSDKNIYIKSIKFDGRLYPSYMIPTQRLKKGVKIELEMSSDANSILGDLFLSSSDGYVQDAILVTPKDLKCTIEAASIGATSKIYSKSRPYKVLINNNQSNDWNYDETKKVLTVNTTGKSSIEVISS